MSRDRRALIAVLARDLRPVRRAGRVAHWVIGWWLLSWTWVVAITSATGPWRPGAIGDVVGSTQLSVELLLGLAAGLGLVCAAFALAIPAPGAPARRSAAALALMTAWLCALLYALIDPALPPSLLGKRDVCFVETALYALPPLMGGLLVLRRLAPLEPGWSGLMLGLAAGAMPAVAMQLACMYEPRHALVFHFGPAVFTAALGIALGMLALRRA